MLIDSFYPRLPVPSKKGSAIKTNIHPPYIKLSSYSFDLYLAIALEAREVPHMPRPPLRLGAFVGKYDLVAGAAPRFQRFRVMPAAV